MVRRLRSVFLFWLSWLVPKDRSLWLFGAQYGQSYSGNPRALFEHILRTHKEIKPVWCSSNMGVVEWLRTEGKPASYSKSLRAYMLAARASCVIVDHHAFADIKIPTVGGARIVQLYHGTPLKKIGLDDPISQSPVNNNVFSKLKRALSPFQVFWKCSLLTIASPAIEGPMMSAFACPRERLRITGYPRNDALFRHTEAPITTWIRGTKGIKNIIAYLPTYRHDEYGKPILGPVTDILFSQRIRETLKETNSVLLARFHPFLWESLSGLEVKEAEDQSISVKAFEDESSRILFCMGPAFAEFYSVLKDVDILITDYSSVYFDFLLLNRPIIFAPLDEKGGRLVERGMYFDFRSIAPGPIVHSADELATSMREALESPERFAEKRIRIREQFNAFVDGNSSERVYREIAELVQQ